MRKSKFTPEQILRARRQAEGGTAVVDIRRKLGVAEATFYRRKRRYAGLATCELRALKLLRDENRRLKQAVADLTLDKSILRDALGKKMVSPAQRRAVVSWARDACRVSERRACVALRVHRALVRYRSVKPDDAPVRRRLHELARDRPSFGVKRLHTMLRRGGLAINHKKVHRLYVEEGLQLRARRRRRRASTERQPRAVVSRANERRAIDFMHDVLATGQAVRVFTVVDVYSRECVALEVARSFSGADVARLLSDAGERRGALPTIIQCDHGTEFTSKALDHWAYWNRVQLDFSRPGKPVDNSVCEAFNGSLRRECLSRHWFASLAEARAELATWQTDYNNHRPHTSLGHQSPVQFRRGGDYRPRAVR